MVTGQIELAAFVEVTLKADLGGFPRVDNGMGGASGLIVDAARAVTGFTTDVRGIRTFRLQPRVSRSLKIPQNFGMTVTTGFGTHELRARNLRRGYDRRGHG
jgi:hypothetical protein